MSERKESPYTCVDDYLEKHGCFPACSECGTMMEPHKEDERCFDCPRCGIEHDVVSGLTVGTGAKIAQRPLVEQRREKRPKANDPKSNTLKYGRLRVSISRRYAHLCPIWARYLDMARRSPEKAMLINVLRRRREIPGILNEFVEFIAAVA